MTPHQEAANAYAELARECAMAGREMMVPELLDRVTEAVLDAVVAKLEWYANPFTSMLREKEVGAYLADRIRELKRA